MADDRQHATASRTSSTAAGAARNAGAKSDPDLILSPSRTDRRAVRKDPSHDARESRRDDEQPDVVVAEDDNFTALLTTEVLRRAGFSVVRASDGEAALEEVERLHPKVMVLDINMPRRDGLEVLRIVRRNLESAQLRILVLSSHGQADVAERARRDGADDYLVKPYAPADLVDRVRRLSDAGRDG